MVRSSSKVYRLFAAVIFVAFAVVEVVHDLVLQRSWPGYSQTANWPALLIEVPVWLFAAFAVVAGRPLRWATLLFAAGFAISHGMGLRMGGSPCGLIFLLGGIAAVLFSAAAEPWFYRRRYARATPYEDTTRVRKAA